jgi:uncharacterized protein
VEITMSPDDTVPSSFDGSARLFPLPNVVLFPQVMLQLHIFEPRYREMTADALAADRLIAMVLMKSGPEGEYEERPALHSIACLGKIVADQRLEDGRYNILLRGLSRVRIVNEVSQPKAYRSARVELLHDAGGPASEPARAYREDLSHFVTAWFAALGLASEQVAKLFQSDLPLGTLVDILSFALPLTIEFKQELLQELDVERRARRLVQYLQLHDPPKAAVSWLHKFPPEFSTN